MAKKPTKELSKEASSNVAAGKVGTDMQKVVERLLAAVAPEKLDKLRNAHERHSGLINSIDTRLQEIKSELDSGIVPGVGRELTSVERENLLNERTVLESYRRKLNNSNKRLSKSLILNSKERRRTIRLKDLRDRVKAPYYYRKYGEYIVPAFDKFVNSSMTEARHKMLADASSSSNVVEGIARVLQSEMPELYIRATGSEERKTGYFAEFQRILVEWDPAKAIIKPNKNPKGKML